MEYRAIATDELNGWLDTLTDSEQRQVVASVSALRIAGPTAGRPLVDSVKGSKHSNMKELRVTRTMRIFFAFDPIRNIILLIGGDKAGKTKRFYRQMIKEADAIYSTHIDYLRSKRNE